MIDPQDFETKSASFDRKTIWKSCCFMLDSRSVIFFSQLFISVLVMLFAIVMLFLTRDNCEAQHVYIALLSSIVGVWLPSPRME